MSCTQVSEQQVVMLRQVIVDLETRITELLADLTTLEAAIHHMHAHLARPGVSPEAPAPSPLPCVKDS